MRAPDVSVTMSTGETVCLSDLYDDRAIALVFLRHFGWGFCRYHVAQLRPYPELPVVFVGMESPEATERFRQRHRSPHRFVADPERVLYEAFGLKRATLPQLANRNTMRRSIEAMRAGHRFSLMPGRDVLQLAGTFVVGRDGNVVWSRPAADVSDNVYADEIRAHLPVEEEARVGGED
jgi:peroxiredoxin